MEIMEAMGPHSIPTLLVTANVGSIFENPSVMLKVWTDEFLARIAKLSPKFIALHCQEVGGKNYENSMKHVEHFVNLLMSSSELRLFDKVRVYLDEDYSSAEHFTALGNFYFVHETIENAMIWNFKDAAFVTAKGKETHSGNIEAVETKEKAKFPQHFFPECKWSRKGFLRTRWSINGTVFDAINIHLFHDASNFVAMESFPSVYCTNRRRALEHTLQRFHNDEYDNVPCFLFGDFNFRTDTEGVIKKLTEGLTTLRVQNNKNNEFTKLQYTNDESELILTVGKKEFTHSNHQNVFTHEKWLKQFDKEVEAFEDVLQEFDVTFPPTYPFEECVNEAQTYMQTRCPAWCDRVLLSNTAKKLIDETEQIEYDLIGQRTCMGDHKPVYLRTSILANSGIIKCCSHSHDECCLPMHCRCCCQFASVTINVTDMSDYLLSNTKRSYDNLTVNTNLLHEPITREMLSHEPYTPESAESHSPCPEIADELIELRRESVSPILLKARLETFLREKSRKKLITRSVSQHMHFVAHNNEGRRPRSMSDFTQNAGVVVKMATDANQDGEWFSYSEVNPLKSTKMIENFSDDDDDEHNANATRKTNQKCCCRIC